MTDRQLAISNGATLMNAARVNLQNGFVLAAALMFFVLGVAAPQVAEAVPVSTEAGCDKLSGTQVVNCKTCVAAGGKYENYKCKKKDGTVVDCDLLECDVKVTAQSVQTAPLTPSITVTPARKKLPHRPWKPNGTIKPSGTIKDRPLSELGFVGGVYIGGKFVPAGGTIALSKNHAIKVNKKGQCVFNTHYKIKNAGPVATPSKFRNRIRVGGAINSTVPDPAYSTGATANAGITIKMVHNTKLKPGVHNVVVSIDDDRNVSESNETNNKLSFRVSLKGSCNKKRPK